MKKEKETTVVVTIADGDYVSYEKKPVSEFVHRDYESLIAYNFLMDVLRKTMGRTLTIIDASVVDKVQNKSMKDLLRQVFSDQMDFTSELVFDQKELQKTIPDNIEGMHPVTIEEALGVEE